MDESVFKYEIEEQGPIQQAIKGEVDWKEVKSRLDETFRELSRQVNLKGFRRGKVPRGLLNRMFGTKVREELSRQISREAVAQAVTEKKLRVVTGPEEWEIEAEEIIDEQPLKFTAVVEVLPKVEPKDYEGIEVQQAQVEVTEDEVDEYLERQQKLYTQHVPVEDRTEIQAGDVVVADIMGKAGDEPVDFQGATIQIPAASSAEQPVEPLPGLAAALVGKDTASGELDLELELPAPEGGTAQKARLLISVERISRPVVPELDDEFAKETGMADDMEGLRKAVRARLAEIREKRIREDMEGQLLEELRRRNPVEISDKAIRQEAIRLKGAFSSMLGMDFDTLSSQDASLGKLVDDKAREQVQSTLILEAIAEKEGVEVTEEDIEAYLAKEAQQHDTSPARLKAQLERSGGLDGLKAQLKREKTIDLLMSKAHVKPKEEGAEDQAKDEAAGKAETKEAAPKKAKAKKTTKKAKVEGEAKAGEAEKAEKAEKAEEAPKKKTRAKKTTKKAKAEGEAEAGEAEEAPKKKTRAKKTTKKAKAEEESK